MRSTSLRRWLRALLCAPVCAVIPTFLAAQTAPLARDQQIAGAVTPLPESMRAGAAVMGYDAAFKLTNIRQGTNGMICLADDPRLPPFHPACYHESLEPFMSRGRELRASGVKDEQVDTVRFAEVKAGKLKMPTQPASLYQIFGPPTAFDPTTGAVTGAQALFVVYTPFATEKSTGLSATPRKVGPWLMYPGTPKAHIMISEKM
ncbi:MAG: hypothetical protein ABI877_07985 [Gemmatimonadaceae bacterium]